MEEALYDVSLYCDFTGVGGMSRLPDRVSNLRFRHLLEQHQLAEQLLKAVNAQLSAKGNLLKEGTVVDATLIAAPRSTKNKDGERSPEMHQTKKGNLCHFGMKEHIGVDADSRLVHTVVGTATNVNDVMQAHALAHGDEANVFGDGGYQGGASARKRRTSRPNGTLRCVRTSVALWTWTPRWVNCATSTNGSKRAFAQRWRPRFASSNASSVTSRCAIAG